MLSVRATGLLLAAIASLAPIGGLGATSSCVLLSRGPAQVRQGEAVRSLPLNVSPCSGVVVVSGDVAVCFLDQHGKKSCKSVAVGTAVADVVSGQIEQSSGSITLALLDLLRGDGGTRTGSSRSIGNFQGLPDGPLLLPRSTLEMTISDPRLKSATKLAVLTDDAEKALVVQMPVSDGHVTLLSSSLERGGRYKWRVETTGAIFAGRFSVVGSDASDDLSGARQIIKDKSLSETARDALLVEFYNDRGYYFERDQLLLEFLPK